MKYSSLRCRELRNYANSFLRKSKTDKRPPLKSEPSSADGWNSTFSSSAAPGTGHTSPHREGENEISISPRYRAHSANPLTIYPRPLPLENLKTTSSSPEYPRTHSSLEAKGFTISSLQLQECNAHTQAIGFDAPEGWLDHHAVVILYR